MRFYQLILIFQLTCCFVYPVNYETEGNLKSDTKVLPSAPEQIKNIHNPVDLFNLCHKLIKEKEFRQAAIVYYTAMAYGIFDTKRVADKTAHQAISVLRINFTFDFSEEEIAEFKAAVKKTGDEPSSLVKFLKNLGYPRYYPAYMIQHGMDAFMQKKTKKINIINEKECWEKILKDLAETNNQ